MITMKFSKRKKCPGQAKTLSDNKLKIFIFRRICVCREKAGKQSEFLTLNKIQHVLLEFMGHQVALHVRRTMGMECQKFV